MAPSCYLSCFLVCGDVEESPPHALVTLNFTTLLCHNGLKPSETISQSKPFPLSIVSGSVGVMLVQR